jgi:subtilisin family serine protease
MSPGSRSLMLAGAIILVTASMAPALADETNQSDQNPAAQGLQPEPRTYVVRSETVLDAEQRKRLVDRLRTLDEGSTLEANVPGLRGDLITTTLSLEDLRKGLGEILPADAVTALPDFSVRLFDGASCEDPEPVQASQALPNICRVTGTPGQTTSTRKVWILDSGLSRRSDAAFNVFDRVNCMRNPCQSGSTPVQVNDGLGHGTMVAGIIGASPFSDGTGINGVSPNAPIVIVKVFGNSPDAKFWLAPRRGLQYVADEAHAGDVVNISFGVSFSRGLRERGFDALRVFDTLIAKMADKGIRVVIAAGNADSRDSLPPWVGFLSPQNMRPSHGAQSTINPSGGVYVVSAVDSQWDSSQNAWVDDFWPFSYFGAEFSEPGVNIKSLWHGAIRRTAVCSGTSFAAPHLSGLLQRLNVDQLQTTPSTGDPDGIADLVAYYNPGAPC